MHAFSHDCQCLSESQGLVTSTGHCRVSTQNLPESPTCNLDIRQKKQLYFVNEHIISLRAMEIKNTFVCQLDEVGS